MVECDSSKFEMRVRFSPSAHKFTSRERMMARRVANRLLGIRKFAVLQETASGWRRVATYPTEEQAIRYTGQHSEHLYCIEEILE